MNGDASAIEFALARIGSLRGVSVSLGRGLEPVDAGLAQRLQDAGAQIGTGGYVLGVATATDVVGHLGGTTTRDDLSQSAAILDLSQSPMMQLVLGRLGIGQASVMALLDITNLQLAGRCVVVCGYGASGQGVAFHVAALGGRVCVVEDSPVRAARALADGHTVEPFEVCFPRAELVFGTDAGPQLDGPAAAFLKDKTLICAAGSDVGILSGISALGENTRAVRDHVDAIDLPHARDLKLIAKGEPLHWADARGLPETAKDFVQALHILALGQLVRTQDHPSPESHLNLADEAALARVFVQSMAGTLTDSGTLAD